MSEVEKQALACVILALEAAKKMVKTLPNPSTTLAEAGKAIDTLIKQLNDEGPGLC